MLNAALRIIIYLLLYGGMFGAAVALFLGSITVFAWVFVNLLEALLS